MGALVKQSAAAMAAQISSVAERVRATNNAEEADAIRKDAQGLRDRIRAEKSADFAGLEVDVAECLVWAMRRVGELSPPKQGERSDLTSKGGPRKFAGSTLAAYRALAAVPVADFEAELAKHRESMKPVTQKALLKVPKSVEASPPAGDPPSAESVARAALNKVCDAAMRAHSMIVDFKHEHASALAAEVTAAIEECAQRQGELFSRLDRIRMIEGRKS